MKPSRPLFGLAFVASVLAWAGPARADTASVTLSNVHLCCNGCVDDVNDTISTVKGADAQADKSARTITVTAADKATVQKAVDALVAAGFYGSSSNPDIKVAPSVAKDGMTRSLTVSGVHLCCGKCVKQLNAAVAKVRGVTGTTAAKDAKSFEIKGDFNPKDVVAALNNAGFAAQVAH